MFGDNKLVMDSSAYPHSKNPKHNELISYHMVREAIAGGYIDFSYIPGESNPADILSKHWGYSQIWPLLKPILFWQGDMLDLMEGEDATLNTKGSDKFSPSLVSGDKFIMLGILGVWVS